MRSGREGEIGASIIEAIIAVAIFALVAVGLSPSLLSSRKVADLSQTSSIASALAQDRLEELHARPSTDSRLTPGAHNDSLNPLRPDGTTGGIYTRTWTVTDNTPEAGVRLVVVTVSWTDRGPRSISLAGLLLI